MFDDAVSILRAWKRNSDVLVLDRRIKGELNSPMRCRIEDAAIGNKAHLLSDSGQTRESDKFQLRREPVQRTSCALDQFTVDFDIRIRIRILVLLMAIASASTWA
jgi:hypothetical protein